MSLVHNFFAGQIKVVTVLTKLDNNMFYSNHKDECVATLFVECPTSDPRGCCLVKPSPPSLKQKNEFLLHQHCKLFTNVELESQNGCGSHHFELYFEFQLLSKPIYSYKTCTGPSPSPLFFLSLSLPLSVPAYVFCGSAIDEEVEGKL